MNDTPPFVAILMRSDSDLLTLQGAIDVLDALQRQRAERAAR